MTVLEQENCNEKKEWHGRGNPQYDPNIHLPLLHEIFEHGDGIAAFCAAARICKETFHGWRHKHPEFKEEYEIALMKGLAIWENKPLQLAAMGCTINHNYWATIMRMRFKYYKESLNKEKEDNTKSRLEAAFESLKEGGITPQEYNQIASGLANESKIVELELKRDELNKDKGKEVPKEVSDAAVEAFMLVKSGRAKVVMIDELPKNEG